MSIDSGTLNIYNGYSTVQQLNDGTYKRTSGRVSDVLGKRLAISQTAYRKQQEESAPNANAEAVLAELAKLDSCRIRFADKEVDLVGRLEKLASSKFDEFMTAVDKMSSSDPETALKGLAGALEVKNTEMQSAIKDMSYKEYKNLRRTLSKVTGTPDGDIKKIMENIMTKLEVTDEKKTTSLNSVV